MADHDELDRTIGPAAVVRSVFDRLDVMVVCYVGPELRVAAANAAARAFTGRFDIVGLRLAELFPALVTQRIVSLVAQVYKTGQPAVGRGWRLQSEHPKTGQLREVYLDFTVRPFHDESGVVIGVISYAFDLSDRVRPRQAERALAAEATRRYEATREVVSQLQQALLPTALPVLPHLDIAARYLVAAHDQAAGGDWFDVITREDGRAVLVVGDVVGHGVAASAAMGQLRAVLKHTVIASADLASAVKAVDAYAATERALRAATAAIMAVDPATGSFEYCLCGHPPPLVVAADGSTRFLAHDGHAPLGVGGTHGVVEGVLAYGDVVLLYSDGLIERPGRTLSEASHELAEVAVDAAANRVLPAGAADFAVARVCQLTVELLTRTGYDDDVTTLAVQLLSRTPDVLSVTETADEAGLRATTEAVQSWLSALRIGDDVSVMVELAVNEAVANAVLHAYPPGRPGPVRVTGRLGGDGIAELCVGDDGTWAVHSASGGGRGLGLMKRIIDAVTITHPGSPHAVGSGTVVTLRHALSRPAMLASAAPGGAGAASRSRVFATERYSVGNTATLRVMGSVDSSSADRFSRELSDAAQGGSIALTVDLTAVTMLTSAGVRELFATAAQLSVHRHDLTLLASAGSPPAVVLDLVGLPFTTRRFPNDNDGHSQAADPH
jgi:serine phosphatase RsbU (regulator of sigma subunit)/anti-sigma regulatory factor (Ser/Thr protein kinase)/anti-anti-sigma regulatory factor